MAYMTLYRKWRPQTFDEMRGQDAIVQALKSQVKYDRIGHAYLFCGTRGTGKTSAAKILARAVNCLRPVDGNPCNECENCRAILEGRSMDVIEMDAASNNGVDNIREIRDQVQYPPTSGKYRVYIIDEVHMLSAGAFNALLKTLEEPPAYVIFILATTDPNRLPITVQSRCQRYDFRRVDAGTIADHLREILSAEQVEAEDAAVRMIARTADGSFRDSLSLLERCISYYYGEKLTYENVLKVLGAARTQVYGRLMQCILQCDARGAVSQLDAILAQGSDLNQVVSDFIWYLRDMMLVQTGEEEAETLGMQKDDYEELHAIAMQTDLDTVMRDIRILSELAAQIRFSPSRRVQTETALIRMMRPACDDDVQSLRVRVEQLEHALEAGGGLPAKGALAQADAEGPDHAPAENSAPPTVEIPPAEYDDYAMLLKDWKKICGAQHPFIYSLLKGTRLGYDKEQGLCILFPDRFRCRTMQEGSRMEDLRQYLNQEYGKNFRIFARALERGEQAPKVVRGTSIPGINMEIEDSDEPDDDGPASD